MWCICVVLLCVLWWLAGKGRLDYVRLCYFWLGYRISYVSLNLVMLGKVR